MDLGTGPFRTKTTRFESGERFVMAVDGDDMPVDWPVVYAAVELRNRGLMLSTMRKEMDAICLLLNWSSKHGIGLDERIESLDLLSLSEIEGLRRAMRVDLRTARKRANGDKSKHLTEVVKNGQPPSVKTKSHPVEFSDRLGPIVLTAFERTLVWLALAFGSNPKAFSLLREEDYRIVQESGNDQVHHILKIPRVKKRSALLRKDFHTKRPDHLIGKEIAALIEENVKFRRRCGWPKDAHSRCFVAPSPGPG